MRMMRTTLSTALRTTALASAGRRRAPTACLGLQQEKGLAAHQQTGHARAGSPLVTVRQVKVWQDGNGSSDSGSNSPEIQARARNEQEQAAPAVVAA